MGRVHCLTWSWMDNISLLSNGYWEIFISLGVRLNLDNSLNLSRQTLNSKISKFSLSIGLLTLAFAGTGIAGFELPFIPTVIMLVGLFIVAEALQKAINKKPTQT